MDFYAHTQGNDKKDWQTLKDHLTAVADMARAFAGRFGAGELGYMAGILYDAGKVKAKIGTVPIFALIKTPPDIRKHDGALFANYHYGRVFVYYNGAQAYYGGRGFRGELRV